MRYKSTVYVGQLLYLSELAEIHLLDMAQIDLPHMAQIDLPGLAEIPWHMTVTKSTRIGRYRATRYGMLPRLPTMVDINLPDMACCYAYQHW